jgi:thiol-disulfide isomerase/thioredoxin
MREKLTKLWDEFGTQLLIVVVGLGAILLAQNSYLSGPHPLEAQQAPGFSLPLLAGGTAELSAHLGTDVVILDFWATWCAPCRATLPEIAELSKEYAGKGVQVYAVNIMEEPEMVRDFLSRLGISLPVALDSYNEVTMLYQAEYIPQTVVIGRDGMVAHVHVGPVGLNELRTEIDALLGT